VLFRDGQSVLFLDEVDKLRNADKEKYGEVMAVLNVGFEDGGVVRRCEGKAHTVTKYDVYSPKALAGIEGVADTLADRSFQIGMERSEIRMPRLNRRKMDKRFGQLRDGLQQWADDHKKVIQEAYDKLPDELDALQSFDDRFQDISEPLIVLATLADAERPEGPSVLARLLDGLNAAAGRREPSGREKQLLEFLVIAFEKLGGDDNRFIRSAELVEACAKIEDLSYIETPKKLASLLKHFDLIPKSNGSERGYDLTREWAEKWESRYPKPKT
jgi:putative DNA primase/helicase